MSRRWILLGLSAGFVAAATALPVLRGSGYLVSDDVARRLRFLEPWQYLVLTAFGRRILAPEAHDIGLFADEYVARLPLPERNDLTLFIGVIEHVAPFFIGSFRRFTSLDPTSQNAVIAALEQHEVEMVRAGFQALKGLALMAYYRLPESWSALGYNGPVVRWEEGG